MVCPPRGVHVTTEVCRKFVPFNWMVRVGDPATAVEGTSEASVGVVDAVMVKASGLDTDAAEFITSTLAVPGVESNAAGTVACRSVAL